MTTPEVIAIPSLESAIRTIVAQNILWLGSTLLISVVFLWLGPTGVAVWLVPVLVFAGIWLVIQSRHERADYQAIRTDGPPQSGQWVAVSGRAQPLEQSDSDILAYWFTVNGLVASSDGKGGVLKTCYDGFYLQPTGIQTESGMVPLAGFPDLSQYHERSMPDDMVENAKEAATKCPYWMPSYLGCQITLSGVRDRVEASLSYEDSSRASRFETKSSILSTGDEVCVFGHWRNGALCPSDQRPKGLPVYAGTAAQVREHLSDTSKFVLSLGVILLVIASAIAVWSLI